jgi:DNA ligase-1
MTTDFKPMLAPPADKIGNDFSKLSFPYLASPKFDGIRCVIVNGKALTRSLKPVPNRFVRGYLEGRPELEGFDGELMVRGGFQAVASAFMGRDGEPDFIFNVFDRASLSVFYLRLNGVQDAIRHLKDPRIVDVPHEWARNAETLETIERAYLDRGFEGVMLRHPHGPYKHGRATPKEGWLIKVKRTFDAEAEIIECIERERNDNVAFTNELGRSKRSSAQAGKVGVGMLGAFRVRGLNAPFTGAEFNVGSGLSDGLRAVYWHKRAEMVGQIIKYRYQPHGVKDLP